MYPTRSTPHTVGFNMPMGDFNLKLKTPKIRTTPDPEEKEPEAPKTVEPEQLALSAPNFRQMVTYTGVPPKEIEKKGGVPVSSRNVRAGSVQFATGDERARVKSGKAKGRPGKLANPQIKEVPRETPQLNQRFTEPSYTQRLADNRLTENEQIAAHLKTIGLHSKYTTTGASGRSTATGRPAANEVNKARQALIRQNNPDEHGISPAEKSRRTRKAAAVNAAADSILKMR